MTLPDSRPSAAEPPLAPARPQTRLWHGRERRDDYDWLRAKGDPEVRAMLEAENDWTARSTAHLSALRDRLVEEIRARTRETDLSVPSRIGGHWYYQRSFEGREYGTSCRVPVHAADDWDPPTPAEDLGPDQPALPGEQVLLDLDALAQGHDFFSVGGSSVTPDGRLLAYSTDVVGDERYDVRVLDLHTGTVLEDRVNGILGGVTWTPTGDAFYYVTLNDAWRPDTVWRHRLGTRQDEDERVLTEPDERFVVGVHRSRTHRLLLLGIHSETTSELHVLDTERPELGFRCFSPRREGLDYSVSHALIGGEDRLLVTHNADGPDFGVSTAPLDPTAPEDWEPLLPHVPGVRVEHAEGFSGHLLVHQRSEGLTRVRVLVLDESGIGEDFVIGFEEEVHSAHAGGNHMFDAPTIRLQHTSLTRPSSVRELDLTTRSMRVLRETPVLGGYDPSEYEEHRLWATSDDGTQVPISLVVRRDARARGPVPVLLYGYGAYEISMDPGFSVSRLSLLDRGAAYAIAHVRGGGELGRGWYDDGKLAHKQNTFTDFAACARHLREQGWASRIVAEGGSAGGLLMGAVANQAPELFDGIAAGVPFVDNLTTMLDASLPLTVTEYDEWGNPEADPEVYDYLASYSPYDNVSARDYPPILAETSLNDTRVLYVEPAKWVSRLRSTAADRRPDVLLRTEMAAGHGGVTGRYKAWAERAFTLAWILDRLGLVDS